MPPRKTWRKKEATEERPSSTEGYFFPEWVTALLESQRQHAEKQEQRHEAQVERLERCHHEQLEHLTRMISQATAASPRTGVTGTSSDVADAGEADPSEILDKVEKHLRSQRNVALDRALFEERRQEEGEAFDSFFVSLKELAGEAELCDQCLEERLTTRIISGIYDAETRRQLLAIRPFPKLEEALDKCRSAEISKSNEADLAVATSQTVNRLSQQRVGRRKPYQAPTRRQDRCSYCGEGQHESEDRCPAWGKYCEQCGKKNHPGVVCRQKKNDLGAHQRANNV